METNMEEVLENIFLKLKELPSGTEMSTSGLLDEDTFKKFSFEELFELHRKLIEKCEMENISLNFDEYAGTFCGLPFDIPFIKE